MRNGWATSSEPIVGPVAWFPYNHVAYVQSINGDGTRNIEEYNQNSDHSYHVRVIPAGSALYLYPDRLIDPAASRRLSTSWRYARDLLDDTDSDPDTRLPVTWDLIPRRTQVMAMTQPLDEARLEEIGFVDELAPTTSAIVVLGYN